MAIYRDGVIEPVQPVEYFDGVRNRVKNNTYKNGVVSNAERDALEALYAASGGATWTDKTNWLTSDDIGSWYGVTVSDGVVSALDLSSNNLIGAIDLAALGGGLPGLTSLILNGNTLSEDLAGWIIPYMLVDLRLQDNDFTGDLSSWVLPSALSILYLHSNSFEGDLSNWVFPSMLTDLRLNLNSFSGDISSWVLPSDLTHLYLYDNSFEGDLSSWVLPSALFRLYLHSNSFSGDLSSWVIPSALIDLRLSLNSFSGDLSSWVLPSELTVLQLYTNSFEGDLSSWVLPSALLRLYLHSNSFSGDLSSWVIPSALIDLRLYANSFSAGPSVSSAVALTDYSILNNGLSEAAVDAILLAIYTRRAAFTHATPVLDISGTNATPSGVLQDGDPPTTGLEYVYELRNDPESEGFYVWDITYTT